MGLRYASLEVRVRVRVRVRMGLRYAFLEVPTVAGRTTRFLALNLAVTFTATGGFWWGKWPW